MNLDSWLITEFRDIDLGDKRLEDRFILTSSLLARNSNETINRAIEDWDDKKGAYRLFQNDKVTAEKIFSCHEKRTFERLKNETFVQMNHDSTYFSFNTKKSIEGLGTIGGKVGDESTWGFVGHYCQAVAGGQPQGIVNYRPWSRGKDLTWDVESERWAEGIEEVEKSRLAGQKFIHVCEREADQFELLKFLEERSFDYVVRSSHDRIVQGGNHYLSWHLKKMSPKYGFKIFHSKTKKYVDASVKYGEVEIENPKLRFEKNNFISVIPKLKLKVIEVSELGIPENREPMRWVLFTSLSLDSDEAVAKVIEIYKQRWHIETYFKALKEGCCRVEHCGLKSYDRLIKYVAVFSILAWRLYWARHLQSTDPEAPAEVAFTPIEIELIRNRSMNLLKLIYLS